MNNAIYPQRFLSVFLPDWPIQRLPSRRPSTGHHPPPAGSRGTMLYQNTGHAQQVIYCCDTTRQLGVRPGMGLAEAQAMAPGAQVLPLNQQEGLDDLMALSQRLMRFSPRVAIDPHPAHAQNDMMPDGLLMDLRGLTHSPDAEQSLLQHIAAYLRQSGLSARLAAASTIGAAWALARYGTEPLCLITSTEIAAVIGKLPPTALRLEPQTVGILGELGITTLLQLLQIPRHQLAARFGHAVLLRIDQALGRTAELLLPAIVMNPLSVEQRFEYEVCDWPMLYAAAELLLQQLADLLRQRQQGVIRLTLKGLCRQTAAFSQSISLVQPTGRTGHLRTVVRPRLESLKLCNGVDTLRITADVAAPLTDSQLTAWDEPKAPWPEIAAGAMDILHTRLAATAMYTLQPVESLVPEVASCPQPLATGTATTTQASRADHLGSATAACCNRPACLLPQPEAIVSPSASADHKPAAWCWRQSHHADMSRFGPETVSNEWWRSGQLRHRNYFSVQTHTGQWLWMFEQPESHNWFVHGLWV
ncbi:MAG: DNA polymerase Y family protein [Phycisphaerales bacterium]|nr:DNA polymerase Y family protein [Phycisphaerales bacterium]